ncbi:chloride channel protein [Acaryochloris sp. CCMEE 5410]|uniref:chloride channel protein n=1 Tax=Acaryochloris sp. CCMEE 5410 TaxID=310037 RepID=UPI00024839AE|nr:chloride channel protein [Acaryochloris sp. CCMEE 5410]KAI9131053.1 chloride channel protein [Acaryochloris sp. CCMEE 5410]
MKLISAFQPLRHLTQSSRFAIIEACLIGLISGLAAVALQDGIGWLGGLRISLANQFHSPLMLPLIGVIGGLTAGLLIETIAPDAKGSGIPQVKAALAQFPIALNWQVALVKLVSGITALGTGLPLGRQGPTVQLGAALAAQLSYWFPTAPNHRQQMIAAGAGAGLAAGFAAPIAGVLFIVEELLHDLSGLTLGTAILSSFIGAVVAHVLGGQNLSISFEQVTTATSFSVPEIPFFILLGILAGGFGAIFNRGLLLSVDLNRRLKFLGLPWRIGLAGGICGGIIGQLPSIFQDNTGLRGLLGLGDLGWQLALTAFVVQFGLTLIAYGSGAPGGLFAPSLVMGAALGNLVGLGQAQLLGAGLPTTYAFVGMGAFFGAVSRVPVTGIVIIFEITQDFNLVLPLMISSVVAYLTAEQVNQSSIYDLLLQQQGIQLQNASPSAQRMLDALTAEDIMQRQVETLPSDLSLDAARKIFSRSHHRGFPVLEDRRLVGILSRTDLNRVTQQQKPGDTLIRDIMTSQPLTVGPTASLSDVLYILNRSHISRLPVLDGRKLIGIITRADIIHAEFDHISGQKQQDNQAFAPSYGVYLTRGPATGEGRILLPLANPDTAETLLKVAVAMAQALNYELECLHIIRLPRNRLPAETPVQTVKGRRLLQRAIRYGQRHQVSVHTQIIAAQDVAQAILEVEQTEHINLLLMGWQGQFFSGGQIGNPTVRTILQQAKSQVLVIRPAAHFNRSKNQRWLIPVSGGPNVQQAIQLLPALVPLSKSPKLKLFQVYPPSSDLPDPSILDHYSQFLKQACPDSAVKRTQICAQNVADAIVELARLQKTDIIVIGASPAGLVHQALKGNIPLAIAQGTEATIILVRGSGTNVVV